MSQREITKETGEMALVETEQQVVLRDSRGRWLKGQCPNPGGRSKLEENVRELAKTYTEVAVSTLVSICHFSKSDSARVQAATALLDRGYGRPSQEIQLEEHKENDFIVRIEAFDPAWIERKN